MPRLAFLFSLIVGTSTVADLGAAVREFPLDPATCSSPSREFELSIDPSARDGRGPATYRMTRAGNEVWSGERPFTLVKAAVSDEGIVVGCAYPEGASSSNGSIQVQRIDPRGSASVLGTIPRTESNHEHGGPSPVVRSVGLQPEHDKFFVHLFDCADQLDEHEIWWQGRLSTGEILARDVLSSGIAPNPELRQAARSLETPTQERPSTASVPVRSIDLPLLGTIEFGKEEPYAGQEVYDVSTAFSVDDRGRFGWVRAVKGPEPQDELVLVDTTGEVLHRVPLGDVRGATPRQLRFVPKTIWVRDDRWLVVTSEYGPAARSSAWWVDVGAGSVTALGGFDCPRIETLSGLAGGRFVVLAEYDRKGTRSPVLLAFDESGKRLWSIDGDPRDPRKLSAPIDLATTSDGEIGVLDRESDRIQVFDASGRYVRTIDLTAELGSSRGQISALEADRDGGWIVRVFGGTPQVRRMDALGRTRAGLSPRRADGKPLDPIRTRCAPDGRLWAAVDDYFMRLSDDGVVDGIVGRVPNPERLDEIATVEVDPKGRIYALDRRTHSVHVFDGDGTRLRVCKPAPGDYEQSLGSGFIAVSANGDVWTKTREVRRERYLHYSPDGARLGWTPCTLDRVTEEWHFKPLGDERWVIGYEGAFLVGADAKVKCRIERGSDHRWLRRLDAAGVAPDGGAAILESPPYESQLDKGVCVVHLCSPDGAPVRSHVLPGSALDYSVTTSLAWNGRWIVLRRQARPGTAYDLVVVDTRDGSNSSFVPVTSGWEAPYFRPFFVHDGRELWLADSVSRTVRRYSLPP